MKKLLFLLISIHSFLGFSQKNNLNLMPWPQQISVSNGKYVITPQFSIEVNQKPNKRIEIATTKFLRRLSGRTGVFLKNGFAFYNSKINNPSIIIDFDTIGKLNLNKDESYQINITQKKISISAKTDIGVIYALETLLQTITNKQEYYYFPTLTIHDFPTFTWRGLMIDVARHFMPVAVIKRNLDAMTSVKMNVFHWHLSDDQGFRFESKKYPKLQELASDGLYYTQNQIKDIINYANNRGIRVIPEIDVPGHATAILTAFPKIASKDTTYTLEKNSGIFNPTLDPTNEETYNFLENLFGEMANLFPDQYFHIGGDENKGKDWNSNKKIQQFKKDHNFKTNHDLQTYFNIRLEKILAKFGKKLVGWEEIMTDKMPTTALIDSWKGVNEGVPAGQSLVKAVKKGYNAILSNGYYLDLMLPASSCYLVDPIPKNSNLTLEEKSKILGGEATMWSELVTPLTIDSRIWPRTAAIAERFWSSEKITNIESMYKRMNYVSFRLEELGITHIRNRNVILRNITNNQNIEALIELTKVYEPLKNYTRNKRGTEYKTYSPFTLFADACTSDAIDAIIFNNLVSNYINSKNISSKKKLLTMLNKWSTNYERFLQIKKINPLLKSIEPLSKNLSAISKNIILGLENKDMESLNLKKLKNQLLIIENPVVDVELAILKSLKKLSTFIINNKS